MKKIVLLFSAILVHLSLFGQWGFQDYRDGRVFATDSITYIVENQIERSLLSGEFASQTDDVLREASIKGLYVSLKNKNNFRMGGSQYADGTPVIYSEDLTEVAGIIIPQAYYRTIIYRAVRSAFSKEQELLPYSDKIICIFIVVDNKGNILETSTGFPIWESHVFQPEQIATLESQIRKNLKFELSSKAKNFNYFEGQITIPFQHYIEDMPEIKLKEEEESFGDPPYIDGGTLTDPPKFGGRN